MRPTSSIEQVENQVSLLGAEQDLQKAVIDLVGELAVFRPGAKIVLLEGGGDLEFDKKMVTKLFPDFAAQVNLISGGNKQRVKALHDALS